MSIRDDLPNKAEFLAQLITGDAGMEGRTVSVQRSHRFPLHIYTQIENLARIGKMPASVVINELLECGLEALIKELPPEVVKQARFTKEEQINRPLVSVKIKAGKKPKS
ncbi:hypothetical protein C8R26_101194 [Nitrosomonas oligotropha]|uniref:Uncharacterized protein n=1 Tax=Nitrosomonas oligotropha TaxID=42354 RepID=A0A2T5I511_9PROT|nr:hypothetical protein [Nitrosomonas oligotropha]PTQ78878.1 hypothetical protein C8R26_101194 [Nitrosomonas oligotropha]